MAARDAGIGGLLDGDVGGLVTAVRDGSVSAWEVLDAAFTRISERDGEINAVVALAADRAEAVVAAGLPDGPLHGLPYLVKDLHADVAGLPLSRGSRLFAGTLPVGTSELVRRVEAAGAVVIGRTNSPELGLNVTTEPVLHGPTRNPHDLTRSPGGSSGGAAAAVAAGMVPAAHATDSGGSIRIPAAWCGLVGFKPTRGLNPTGPERYDDWSGLTHEHAVTRTVGDSALLLRVTAGPLGGDPYHVTPSPVLGRPTGGERLTIGLVTAPLDGAAIDGSWRAAAEAAGAALDGLGHRVVPRSLPTVAAEVGPVLAGVISGHLAGTIADLESTTDRRAGAETLEPAVLDLLERGRRASAADLARDIGRLRRLQRDLAALFDGCDLVLTPTTALPAPRLGELHTDRTAAELFADIFVLAPFTAMFNVTGGPALSLPWGRDPDGLPLGVQVAGPPGADAAVLEVAAELEGVST